MPPQKKSKKNTPTETDQEEHYNEEDNRISFTAEPSHLHKPQIKNGGQNLRLSRRQELRKQHILYNHSLKKMLMKMMTRLSIEN
jgi:hypothetical protein